MTASAHVHRLPRWTTLNPEDVQNAHVRRLLHWKTFYPSPWSMHYYGQRLMYNDCVFRWRHVYEHLVFLDRDEFLHFPQQQHKQARPPS